MALSDYSAVDQQIIRTVIGAEGVAPDNEELGQYQAYVAANSINALSNLLIAEDAALLTTEALADQIVANFGVIEATGVKDQATAYVLGRLNKEGADVGAIIAQIATVLGDPALSVNLNPIYLDIASTFQATTEAGLVSSAVETFTLTTGLAAIAAATTAHADYQTANNHDTDEDGDVDAADDDIGEVATAAGLATVAAEEDVDDVIAANSAYNATDYETATDGVQATILAEVEATLAGLLAAQEAEQAVAQAAVTAIVGLQGAVNTENAAIAAEVITQAAEDAAVIVEANAAIAWVAVANGQTGVSLASETAGVLKMTDGAEVTLTEVDGVTGVVSLIDAATIFATAGNTATLEEITAILALPATTAYLAAANTLNDAVIADAAADQAVLDADTAIDAIDTGLGGGSAARDAANDLAAEVVDVAAEQLKIDTLAAAVAVEVAAEAAQAAADAEVTELADLAAAIVTATGVVTGEGYTIDSAVAGGDTAGVDVHMANELVSGNAIVGGNVTLADAGDVIYLGDAVLNSGDIATDGDNNVLEFFLTESVDGLDTIITLETSLVGSNTNALADTATITLTGITNAELSVDGGLITLA